MAITISQNKGKCIAGLAVMTGIASAIIAGIPVTIQDLVRISANTISVTVLVIGVFDKCLWRFIPECLLGVPKIYGTWKGTLHSQWWNVESKEHQDKEVSPLYLVIRQTFSSLQIAAYTSESLSYSLSTSVVASEAGGWRVCYAYDNSPQLKLQSKSPRHRGAGELHISNVNGNNELKGEYWTDRWSQGTVILRERKQNCGDSFESAAAIFKKEAL